MAIGAVVEGTCRPRTPGRLSYPVSIQSDWQIVCTAPETAESGDAVVGGKVVNPGEIVRADQHWFSPDNRGATLLVSLEYNADVGTPTNPVVRIFGKDHNGRVWALHDSTGSTELTIAVSVTLNAAYTIGGADRKMTQSVAVDLEGAEQVIVAVQTAFAAGSGTVNDSVLLVKLAT